MHTSHSTPTTGILRDLLDPARAPQSRRRTPETLRGLSDWILRDLGMSRSRGVNGRAVAERGKDSVMLRAFYGL